MSFPTTNYYHFHIYVVSKEIHYDDRGSLASHLINHPAVDSLGLYKDNDDIPFILSEHRFINTLLIDPYTLGFEETMTLIEFLRNPKNVYRRICIVLLNRNREGESLNEFLEQYPQKKHYLKLTYNYDVPDIEASLRLDNAISEWQIRWFRDLYTYELAISYCSADSLLVEPIVNLLKEKINNIFYDVDKRAELVGDDLEKKLPAIYGSSSRHCIMFVSKDYINRMWPLLERKTALARNELEPGYIIPISIDNTAIPEFTLNDDGLRHRKNNSSMVHYDYAEGADNIVSMILSKVWVMRPKSFNYFSELK